MALSSPPMSMPKHRGTACFPKAEDIVRGAVSYPHGWGHAAGWRVANAKGGANVNVLASSDPKDWEFVSATPLLDGIPVIVKPPREPISSNGFFPTQ